jgi:alginate O-acetyltransferase complex protein AlgJ
MTLTGRVKALLVLFDRWAVVVVFFVMLALPIALFGRPGLFGSELHENRNPAPFPEPSLFFLQRLGAWFSDHFGMRSVLISRGTFLQTRILGLKPMNPQVVVGKDGWLFFDEGHTAASPRMADLRGYAPLDEALLKKIVTNLESATRVLKHCGIPFYLVMAPDKQTLYPEMLPFSVGVPSQTRADQLIQALRDAPEVNFIDLRAPLREAKSREALPLYKKTDTHWNTLGAFFGYQVVLKRLVADGSLPPSPRHELKHYVMKEQTFEDGNIAVNMLSLPGYFADTRVMLTPHTPRTAHEVATPTDWPDVRTPSLLRRFRRAEGQSRLLLYRDSFAEEMLPFLAEDFAEVTAIWQAVLVGDHVMRAKPNLAILEFSEQYLWGLRDPPIGLEHLRRACNGRSTI